MPVAIRAAAINDKEACIELLQDLSDTTGEWLSGAVGDAFERFIDSESGQILLAEDDGELLGLASATYSLAMRFGGEYCQIEELVVEPSARGRKVGTLLFEETLKCARDRGCAEICAYVVEQADDARSYYERFGFENVGVEMRQRLIS